MMTGRLDRLRAHVEANYSFQLRLNPFNILMEFPG